MITALLGAIVGTALGIATVLLGILARSVRRDAPPASRSSRHCRTSDASCGRAIRVTGRRVAAETPADHPIEQDVLIFSYAVSVPERLGTITSALPQPDPVSV